MHSNDSYSIILVDDNHLLRDELKILIEGKPDLKVIGEAGSGIEVLALLYKLSSQNKAMPQLVILDISMPYLGGIETARQIKQMYPTVKVLFLSIHNNQEYLDYAVAGGAEGYLLKDEMDSEILSAIAIIRQGGNYVSPGFIGKITDAR